MPRKQNIIYHALQLGLLIFALITLPFAHDLLCLEATAQGLDQLTSSDSASKLEKGHDHCSEGMSESAQSPASDPPPKEITLLSCCVPSGVGAADIGIPYLGVAELAMKVSLPSCKGMQGIDHRPLEKPPRSIV